MKRLKRFFVASLGFMLGVGLNSGEAKSQPGRLFINEFMASNQSTVTDANDEYDDWIEIFNGENFDIDLSGYFLTDNFANAQKWAFPSIVLPAGGYLLVWADNQTNQSGCHASFKLDKDGEQLGLYWGTVLVDSITFGPQRTDVSFGRRSDGETIWVFFEPPSNAPTPGAANRYSNPVTLPPPRFFPSDGFYLSGITVELRSDDPNAVIYYTLDGKIPTPASEKYVHPIDISVPTTIRAMCYKSIGSGQYQTSKVVSSSYLVDVANTLPLINIICDPDEHNRIYSWPQPGEPHGAIAGQLKLFDGNHVLQADLPIELSMRGGYSLLSPKKSYQVDFVAENLQFDLFDQNYSAPRPNGLPTSFHSINLSGMAADYSLIRNYLSFQLLRQIGAVSPQVAFVRLFINGQDRGIYVATERIDQWLVKNRLGNARYDIIKTGIEHRCNLTWDNQDGQYFELKEGDFKAFNHLINWLNDNDRSYAELSQRLDIPSFLYYDLMCRFSNNKDSYDINYYLVRNREQPDAKWVILIWDCDESFGWDSHVSGNWFPHNRAFDLLRSTAEYQQLFYTTLADLFNTRWSQAAVGEWIGYLEQAFQTDNPADEAIWNESWASYARNVIPNFELDPNYHPLSRYTQFDYIKKWVGQRISYQFSLWSEGTAQLTIDPPIGGEGAIQLNSLKLSNFPWTGRYFKNLTLQLKALPGPGYAFDGWSDATLPQLQTVSIALHQDYRLHAKFRINNQLDRVIINEINYNSAPDFDPEDWIELYNPADHAIDLSGWHVKDDNDAHDFILPSGTAIPQKGYLVICRDAAAFRRMFPGASGVVGDLGFSLGNDGDQVRLYNAAEVLLDSVAFDDRAPWLKSADGDGATLELIDPTLNNTLAENWQASLWHGTPGQRNSFSLVIHEINYRSAPDFDPDDWIEIYNPANRTVDVSGCHLQHQHPSQDFLIPSGTSIPGQGFIILCRNRNKFLSLFPDASNVIGDFGFSLDDSGDEIRILHPSNNLIDSVRYANCKPWPMEANGHGATLELLDPGLDNTVAGHWQASAGHGTPGQATRALPVVTRISVRAISGSRLVTNDRTVLVEIAATDFDGHIVGWHINESGIPPSSADFRLTSPPTTYTIQGLPGIVNIYGWVLDNDNQVSRLTDTSHVAIRLHLTDQLFSVEGCVHYVMNDRPVPAVQMMLKLQQGIDWDSTDANGYYRFAGLDSGAVTLQPIKEDDIRQAICGADVLQILRHLAEPSSLSPEQFMTANVIPDENLTLADARAMLRYLVFRRDQIGRTGSWRFVPAETSLLVTQNLTRSFHAYLAGDVDLNWGADSLISQLNDSLMLGIALRVGQVESQGAQFITVPVSADITRGAIHSLMFSLHYDSTCLIYQWAEVTTASKKFIFEDNADPPGKLHIAMAGFEPIMSSDMILTLHFKVNSANSRNRQSQLIFTRAVVNDHPVKTFHGVVILTDTGSTETPLPQAFKLFQNYPNPFNSQTQIRYQLVSPGPVQLTIYDLMGRRICVLQDERNQAAGSYQVAWDGRDEHGASMPSGIYLYELRSGRQVQRHKMVVVK